MNCLSLLLALSLHIGLEGNYNQVHPHARCTTDHFISGAYYNSEDNVSLYIGKVIEEVDRGWDLELGIVTGYSGMDVAPMIRYINDGWWVAPAYEQSHGGNVGVTIGYEFKLGD